MTSHLPVYSSLAEVPECCVKREVHLGVKHRKVITTIRTRTG